MTVSYVVLGALFAGLIFIGYISGRVKKELANAHFLIANREIGAFLVAVGLIMGWTDAGVFSFTGGLIIDGGYKTMAVFIAAEIFAFFFLYMFAGKIRRIGHEKNMYMMSDILKEKYSVRSAVLGGVITLIYFFLWLLVQFLVGADLLHGVFGISYIAAAFLMGIVTCAYLILGGFRSQVLTDVLQFGFLAALVAVVTYYFLPSASEWSLEGLVNTTSASTSLFSLFIITASSTIAAPDVWQRLYSAKNERTARISMLMCAGIIVVVNSFFASLGLIAKHYGWATGANDLTSAVFSHIIPSWFLPIGLAVFFCLVLSTVATTLFGSSMAITNDILFTLKKIPSEKVLVRLQKVMMCILVVLAVFLSLSQFNLVSIVFYSFIVCLIPLPIIVSILMDIDLYERAVFWSMVAGLITFLVGVQFGYLDGVGALLPFMVEFPILLIIQIIIKKKQFPIQN